MKFWKPLLLASLLFIPSCDSGKVLDDPYFNYVSGSQIKLRVHLFKNLDELRAAYKKLSKKDGNVIGFAIMQNNLRTNEPSFCDIFVLETPYAHDTKLATWGHELKHCLEGNWHSEGLDR